MRQEVDRLLSVEDAGAWKPARAAYDHAVRETGRPAQELLLVAVHPWDVDGASRAGLRTAWLDRTCGRYPTHLLPPELTASSLVDLAQQLSR